MKAKNIEILAPAGSFESLVAAVNAGADAVYVGGTRFGARAHANNFDERQLIEAIDYVHLHGRRIYLTINTLLKEEELENELYDYLLPFYERGIDAVIVQDIGVLSYLKEYFPKLPIHASTQMTITDTNGVRFLEEQGVSRVVLARELGLSEISEIVKNTSVEIECFVHGALCYCYSGQCLYSSLLGGRSGNRGECAQPCRLPYEVEGGEKSYIMSLKDICTLNILPELVEAGITSFKIEGRMKKPEYVSTVVSMYRKYLDSYLARGKEGYIVKQEDWDTLLDIYNRGGFHTGYLQENHTIDMLTRTRPNHAGIEVVRMIGGNRGEALKEIHPGDVLDIPGEKHDYTIGKMVREGETFTLSLPPKCKLKSGTLLSRIRNESLISEQRKKFVCSEIKEKINGKLILSVGESAKLWLGYREYEATITGEIVQKALNHPMDEARILKQMRKTGNTSFIFDELEVVLKGDVFVPVQELNELRRQGIEAIENQITNVFKREKKERTLGAKSETQVSSKMKSMDIYASVQNQLQFEECMKSTLVSRIYIDNDELARTIILTERVSSKQIYLAMPYIFRKKDQEKWNRAWKQLLPKFDGVLIRNYESFSYLKKCDYRKDIVTDYNLYVMNQNAIEFWKKHGIGNMTAPIELNRYELGKLELENCELVGYGFLPMMISANCIQKNSKECTHISGVTKIKDRYQKELVVKNECRYCYNVIYNSLPLLLIDQFELLEKMNIKAMRLMFTIEDIEKTKTILEMIDRPEVKKIEEIEFTRGHFKRGVK